MKPRTQVRRLARLIYGDAINPEEDGQGEVPVYGSNGVYAGAATANTLGPAIIIGRKGSFGKINWTDVPCWASDTTFFIDRQSTGADLRWLYYALQTLGLDEASGEAAVPGISREKVYEHHLPVMDLKQQRSIASYLDDETEKLDRLIEQKKGLLTLLSEKRRALITHAITCGLDADALRRDFGISWLGEIPAHWTLLPLRRLVTSLEQGWSPVASNLPAEDQEYGVLKLSAIKGGRFFHAENKALAADLEVPTNLAIRKDDIFITRANTPGLVGDVAVSTVDYPNLIFSDLIYRIRVDKTKVSPDWLTLALLSDVGRRQVEAEAKGSSGSMVKLSQDQVLSLLIPVPPKTEQQSIAAYVQIETMKLKTFSEATEYTLALLHERRFALISAAVTGQLSIETPA